MKKKVLSVLLVAMACVLAVMVGCSSASSDSTADSSTETTEHEPITIMDAQRDYSAIIALVKEKYPEINIEVIPYRGRNMSAYTQQQLETGIMPDIYSSTQAWDAQYQKENLLDLTHYDVSKLYNSARLSSYMVDGAAYLLPYDYQILGITYNKTLLEENNIAVPTSFNELRDVTIPALKEKGIEVCTVLSDLPGASFNYFFSLSSSVFMNTAEGKQWMSEFADTNSDTFALGNENVTACTDYIQQWIDCGMIDSACFYSESSVMQKHFKEGNTAFYIGSMVTQTENEDGTGDQYGLLPYLSEDGTSNNYYVSPNRMYGLNKELTEPGNEQKLEDAMHFLEVLSSNEGYIAMCGESSNFMCSIDDFEVATNSFYAEPLEQISLGHSMNLVYVGWENYLVPFGEATCSWLKGESTAEDALGVLDDTKRSIQEEGETYYATATEELDTVQAAQLSGQMFMEATGADAALISYNVYSPDVKAIQENSYGANGHILPSKMTEELITIFLPTGWYDTLTTFSATGSKIKEMAESGTNARGTGYYYPFVFMTADGQELADDETYTVVICGVDVDEKDSLGLVDTGIVGLDAAKEYLLKVKEVSTKTLDSSLVISTTSEGAGMHPKETQTTS